MNKIRAIYGNGIFRPEKPVGLPEGTVVDLEVYLVQASLPPPDPVKKLSAINAILAEQCRTQNQQPIIRRIENEP
jgi:predicted DNA-binding antitoxin AbrB/MazE fold protein